MVLGRIWQVSAESMRNPSGADDATSRVIRGGRWRSDARFCRAAYRGRSGPGTGAASWASVWPQFRSVQNQSQSQSQSR